MTVENVQTALSHDDFPRSQARPIGSATPRKKSISLRSMAVAALGVAVLFVALCAWKPIWIEHEISAARESLRQFEPKAANKRLTALLARWPECAEAEFLLAVACRRGGQLDLVESHLARAGELGWDAQEIDRQRYLMVFQAGDFRTSGDEIMALLLHPAVDDDAEECYEAVARGYLSTLLLQQAEFILDGWIDWRPQSVQPYLLRAELALLQGDPDGEIAAYRDILRFAPAHNEARLRLGQALMLRNEVDEAYNLFMSCVRDWPRDPDALLGLAEWQQRRGHADDAKKLVATALDCKPDHRQRAAALSLQGQIALSEKDYMAAVRVLRQAVDADPSSVPVVYGLSQALSRAGREQEAKVYVDRWQRLQELENELGDLHPDILTHPEDPDLRSRIGKLLLEKGETRAGVNWLLSVLFYEPSHAETNRLLAEHYERIGQAELAARHRAVAEGQSGAATASVPSDNLGLIDH